MITLNYCPYTLRPFSSLNAVSIATPREGILLKVEWKDGHTGYADLMPWPELGDVSLDEQLANLKTGKISRQIEQSIWMARRDAVARKDKKNLLDGVLKIKNNFIFTHYDEVRPGFLDELKKAGFDTLKLKVGRDLQEEADLILRMAAAGFKLRLDFNAVANWQIFEKFMTNLGPSIRAWIEYVEDPFPFEEKAWHEARQFAKIAVDNQYDKIPWETLTKAPCDVMIIKPAKRDVDEAIGYCQKFKMKAAITSYMDHAVGLTHAVSVAMELKLKYAEMILEAGCLTQRLYQMDPFFAELSTQGPYLLKVKGTGVGFDKLLEALPWQPIKIR